MDNHLNAIQIVILALMIFGLTSLCGWQMHIDRFPEDTKWIRLSNNIFSFLTTAWTLFGVLHFQELQFGLPMQVVFGIYLILVVGFPYFILRALLRAIEKKMLEP